MKTRRIALAAFVCLQLAAVSRAENLVANETARHLAGLTAGGDHAAEMDRAWADIEKRQLVPIREWMQLTHPELVTDTLPLLYPFSGPDFLYAHTFYPNARAYVLCGIEPVGTPPDLTTLSPGQLQAALGNLRRSLDAVLSFSFFITSSMKNDLSANATQLSGTLPVLYAFLARAGCEIRDVTLIGLDPEGVVLENPEKTKHPGVRILFRRSEMHEPQTLYFFSSDLSSWNIKQNPGFKRFCESLGPCNGFTKSASYLMHLDSFESVRDLLLARCETMLQDDTGIMWKDFPREVWSPVAYGWYPGPIERFKDKYQTDLATWYRENKAAPIPFGIGYNWRPGMSTLIFAKARREPLKALPVE